MSAGVASWARPEDVPLRPRIGAPLAAGAFLLIAFFAGFGGWAALAPLSSATVAEGVIRVETHRKTVQHLEGGIVREILVNEGDKVTAGQVLMRLDKTQSGTTVSVLQDQQDALLALQARLEAERDGLDAIQFPPELSARQSDPKVATVVGGQQKIFDTRRQSLRAQLGILSQRVEQLGSEIAGHKAQLVSANEQIQLTQEEIATVTDLLNRGLERKPRLLALQRQQSYLEGSRGEQLGAIAKAQQEIGEAKLQSADLLDKRSSEIALELRDTQSRLLENRQKLGAAVDVDNRMEVVAPVSGQVVDLKVHTLGGVVRPGDALLDIVPQSDELVVEARVRPVDIDAVHAGQSAQVALTAYKQRTTPRLDGRLATVSADALIDESRHISYYSAEIHIDSSELAKLNGVQLYPGMPAEVMIVTGERTLLQYFIQPVIDSFHRAFREE
jgi:HlyD family type I secretion membrane fusion protein